MLDLRLRLKYLALDNHYNHRIGVQMWKQYATGSWQLKHNKATLQMGTLKIKIVMSMILTKFRVSVIKCEPNVSLINNISQLRIRQPENILIIQYC